MSFIWSGRNGLSHQFMGHREVCNDNTFEGKEGYIRLYIYIYIYDAVGVGYNYAPLVSVTPVKLLSKIVPVQFTVMVTDLRKILNRF